MRKLPRDVRYAGAAWLSIIGTALVIGDGTGQLLASIASSMIALVGFYKSQQGKNGNGQ